MELDPRHSMGFTMRCLRARQGGARMMGVRGVVRRAMRPTDLGALWLRLPVRVLVLARLRFMGRRMDAALMVVFLGAETMALMALMELTGLTGLTGLTVHMALTAPMVLELSASQSLVAGTESIWFRGMTPLLS